VDLGEVCLEIIDRKDETEVGRGCEGSCKAACERECHEAHVKPAPWRLGAEGANEQWEGDARDCRGEPRGEADDEGEREEEDEGRDAYSSKEIRYCVERAACGEDVAEQHYPENQEDYVEGEAFLEEFSEFLQGIALQYEDRRKHYAHRHGDGGLKY